MEQPESQTHAGAEPTTPSVLAQNSNGANSPFLIMPMDGQWTEYSSGFSLFPQSSLLSPEAGGVQEHNLNLSFLEPAAAAAAATAAGTGPPAAQFQPHQQVAPPLPPHAGGAPVLPPPQVTMPQPPRGPALEPPPQLSPSSASASSTRARRAPAEADKKRRKRNRELTAEELKLRRARHNEVEIRRRKKIAEKFDELRELTGCDSSNKGGVLACAAAALRHAKATIEALKQGQEAAEGHRPRCTKVFDDVLPAVEHDSAKCAHETESVKSGKSGTSEVARSHELGVRFNISGWYDTLFCHSSVPMMMNTLTGQNVAVNDALASVMGCTHEELLATGTGLFSMTSPESLPATFAMVNRLMSGEISSAEISKTLVRADGNKFEARCTVWLLCDDENQPKLILSQVVPLGRPSHGAFGTSPSPAAAGARTPVAAAAASSPVAAADGERATAKRHKAQ